MLLRPFMLGSAVSTMSALVAGIQTKGKRSHATYGTASSIVSGQHDHNGEGGIKGMSESHRCLKIEEADVIESSVHDGEDAFTDDGSDIDYNDSDYCP